MRERDRVKKPRQGTSSLLYRNSITCGIAYSYFLVVIVAFYDLFRLENGMIAEHWDTIETIPAQSDWKNTNGKFGFK